MSFCMKHVLLRYLPKWQKCMDYGRIVVVYGEVVNFIFNLSRFQMLSEERRWTCGTPSIVILLLYQKHLQFKFKTKKIKKMCWVYTLRWKTIQKRRRRSNNSKNYLWIVNIYHFSYSVRWLWIFELFYLSSTIYLRKQLNFSNYLHYRWNHASFETRPIVWVMYYFDYLLLWILHWTSQSRIDDISLFRLDNGKEVYGQFWTNIMDCWWCDSLVATKEKCSFCFMEDGFVFTLDQSFFNFFF